MFILIFLKSLTFLLRKFTSNSGTALPGLILEKYFPKTLKRIFNQLDNVVLITGTNGKTTTSRMLTHLLNQNNVTYIANISGSNMIRGIASILIENTDLHGNLKEKLAILEAEEATMPKLTQYIKPNIIIVTNLFRDQLDAYGEIDKTYEYVLEAVKNSHDPDLILNKDDERVVQLSNYTTGNVDLVSVEDNFVDLIKYEKRSNSDTKYKDSISYNNFLVKSISINNKLHTQFDIYTKDFILKDIKTLVPGIYSTLNATCAILAFLRLEKKELKDYPSYNLNLNNFQPVFGRGEIIKFNNTRFQILLVKNPAGMDLNLSLLEHSSDRQAILLILNDNIADGRDVSWIWDCNLGLLKDLNFEHIYVAGSRRWDMALRVKYEGLKVSKVFPSIKESIRVLSRLDNKKVFILPTYTGMREVRKSISLFTTVKEIWKGE